MEWRQSTFTTITIALLGVATTALNCALPEPSLLGVRNGSTVVLPLAITLTNSQPANANVFVAALHNGHPMAWHTVVEIVDAGEHRIVATTIAGDRECSRVDHYVFTALSSAAESEFPTVNDPECLDPEVHLVIFWSFMATQKMLMLSRLLAALSEVSSFPSARYPVVLRQLLLANVGPGHELDEDWYSSLYGDSYYGIYFNSPEKVDMLQVKGYGSFLIAVLEDLCPSYAYELGRDEMVSVNMFMVKKLLRQFSSNWYHVHTTLSVHEARDEFAHLFGMSATAYLVYAQRAGSETTAVIEQGLYAPRWRRVLLPIDATEAISAFIRTEWHHLEVDIPSLQAELGERVMDPAAQSSMDIIHRAAFLGASRIALIAHLPFDIKWYKAILSLSDVAAFRVMKENSWQREFRQCTTVAEAARLQAGDSPPSATDTCTADCADSPSQSHSARIQQLVRTGSQWQQRQPIIAVSASIDGPFTILDGNHRAVALARSHPADLPMSVYIGIGMDRAGAMEGAGGKKKEAFFSPSGMIKRGWRGVTSPVIAIKDSVYAAATPRASVLTPTGAASVGGSANRMTLPSPAEYPSLFAVGAPSSTRSMDGSSSRQFGMGAINEGDAGVRAPQSARASSNASRTSSRTSSRERSFFRGDDTSSGGGSNGLDKLEEERAYLAVCHHNLHSVLTNPKASNWGGALLDALYPTLEAPDIPMIPFPGLQDVSARDFEPYLKRFGKNAKTYEDNHVKPVSEQLSSSNVPSIAVADQDVAKCLDAVPNMFFRPDFDFTDPAIFEEVMTMNAAGSLQDELTGYLDRVEFTLLRQVSSRSDRFFEASADQEVMKQSIKVACDQVATLRKTMDRLRNGLADKTLDIVSLHRRQKRIAELHELVTLIESVKSAESAVEALVQCQDYPNALDLIDSSLATLHDHLQGIHGLSSLGEKFRGFRGFISSQISQQFISTVTSSEWMYHEQERGRSFSQDSQERTSSRQSLVGGKTADASVVQDLTQLVNVLFRLDALDSTVATYRDRLNEEVKMVVKTVVTETIAVSSTAKSTGSASDSGGESKVSVQLRALTSDEFLQCIEMIFEHLIMILMRAVVVQEVLVKSMNKKIEEADHDDTTHHDSNSKPSDSQPSSTWTPAENATDERDALGDWKKKTRCTNVIRDIDEVLRKTCEFSQRSVSNLFAVRKEVQAVYTMPQLRVLYDTTMAFVGNVEKLTGKTDYTLRGALFSQLKLFLEKYHQAQLAKLVSTLDHELWKNTEISVARHKALEDLSSGRGVPLTLSSDREIEGETAAPFKAVAICGKSFRVVWSVLLMLEIVMNYMSCAANFPVLATDVLQRSIEIFRLFNSRTTQLVLGAGAMQVARLKSISTRHLALASQSLDLSMTLIPHIKAALAAHFSDRQKLLLDEFDRVLRDYAEHNEKIFSKFTSIVEDIMKKFLENLPAVVDYDSSSMAVPSKQLQNISLSTLKLHAVLQPVLSPVQMRDVMSRVFDMFTQKLPECFKGVQPKTPNGKKRVVDDVGLFIQSFGDVKEVEFNGDALLRHFRSTYTPS